MTQQTEYQDLEVRHRAAIIGEDPGETRRRTPKTAERRALEERVEVRRYIGAAMDGGAVDGAEAELKPALKMGRASFPLRLLAPERETRANAVRAGFIDDDGANEDAGDITGLTTHANVSESTISKANKVKWPATVKTFTDLIDGVYASSPADLRIVAAVGASGCGWRPRRTATATNPSPRS